ncbi:hypothetical protein BO85DRAFT_269473 [Aspergillus piperis CBS 112811]|uniref:Apple domain-containing protein n=1 Tax=Aspergillus piperis CBS 112811 TaxID=1448313 RepID=A0A8G1R3I1_9EURO|nr:hypothetical protein BO85DRAFT_269473 [Aspergillus piperis CBS 112811]RAH59381.1 hypothetical protein BO85DRAFT_269473 [Aspergillus piperis CBS 112811]
MMVLLKALSVLLAVEAAQASSPSCTENLLNDTISFFSHAPLTFSYEVNSTTLCAARCARVPACHAWLYSTSGRECQLYRQQPVSQAYNPQFISGICGEPSKRIPNSAISASSSLPSPLPSAPAVRRVSHDASNSGSAVKRDYTAHHQHHHHHTHHRQHHGH